MRARFIGDPRHGGEGRDPSSFMGVVFPKGEWVEDVPDSVAAKLIGHSHFEVEAGETKIIPPDLDGDGKPGGSLPADEDPDAAEKAQLRADLAELGVNPHHKTGLPKLRELLEQATKPGEE